MGAGAQCSPLTLLFTGTQVKSTLDYPAGDGHVLGGSKRANTGRWGREGQVITMENSCLDRQNLTFTQTRFLSQSHSVVIP